MKEVAILGIGQTPFGVFPNRNMTSLGREAINAALKDANISWRAIQYVVAGFDTWGGWTGTVVGSVLEAEMGYLGIPATTIHNACATGAYALDVGRALILSGMKDVVLCVGAFKAPGGFFPTLGDANDQNNFDAQRFRLLGKTNPTMFAFQAIRRMHNYGMTEKDIALVKVKNSKNGKHHPFARYKREYTLEEVMASPMVAYPLRLFEIAATSDGSAAVILCSLKKAREFTTKPIRLSAVWGPQPKYPNMDVGLSPLATQCELSTQREPRGWERPHEYQVAHGAMEQAGIGPEDLDFAEVYDLSTAMELDWMEDIGICKAGEAEKLLREGAVNIGGRIPINPSGGVATFGEAPPAQALLQTCCLTTQLRGTATGQQVEKARLGLAINKGLNNSISCIIARR